MKPDLSDLERLVFALRSALEALLDEDAYDRWGAQHDTEESRAAHAAVASRAAGDHERVTRELDDLVARMRREDPAKIAQWCELHIAYLRSLPLEPSSTEASVRDDECAAWSAVARSEQAVVKENVFYVRIDPARYTNVFGFAPH